LAIPDARSASRIARWNDWAPRDIGSRICRTSIGGKDVLPAPFAGGGRVLAGERDRHRHRAETGANVHFVQPPRNRNLFPQTRTKTIGQHRHAILRSLAVADKDLAATKIDILDAPAQPFQDAHAGAVEQFADKAMRAAKRHEQRTGLRSREDHGQARRRFRAYDAIEPRQFDCQHFPVEKEQCALGLVLCRRRNTAIRREMREKRLDVGSRQIDWMAIAVKADVAPDPVDVGLLGPYAVVLEPDT
jgi:hypothetical protein